MATIANPPVTPDTLITIKIHIEGSTRKLKLPLHNLSATVLPDKLRNLLDLPANQEVKFERYSDSAAAFVTLEPNNPTVYKTLYRAAKAKLKLRLRVTPLPVDNQMEESSPPNIPGSFVQPPSPPVVTSTAPTAAASTATSAAPINHWATLAPAIVSSQPTSSSVPAPAYNTHRPVSVNFPVAKPGEDAASRARARQQFFAELSNMSQKRDLALRLKETVPPLPAGATGAWSVYCNECDKPMLAEHFHCSICDDGDYDLCQECVSAGKVCPGANHWLIKRTLKDGRMINSITEKVAPKPRPSSQAEKEKETEMPGAFTEEPKAGTLLQAEPRFEPTLKPEPTRTCNSCVKVFGENKFVHCTNCDDYDLCLGCHSTVNHGHHPAHEFRKVDPLLKLPAIHEARCRPGRNQRHAATCDGCDKSIFGVRHKCFECPDFDLCSECVKRASHIHQGHRFAPLYDPLPSPRTSVVRHYGIYCDGPLCSGSEAQTFITGIRYKCAVCPDFDLCANCEALPSNAHNSTHPMVKLKMPVRNVTVTTMGEDKDGASLRAMGDQPCRRSTGTGTSSEPAAYSSAFSNTSSAAKVQTIADLKPTDFQAFEADPSEASRKIIMPSPRKEATDLEIAQPKDAELNAHFVRDTIPDGSNLRAEERFTQAWTLRNPGPHDWPAGCSVRYVGGDNMLNVDHSHPASAAEIAVATESNVIDHPVKMGGEVDFRILMKAPKRMGKSISYWRLKAPNGTPFGHRLWCDINVQIPALVDQAVAPAELGSTNEHKELPGPSTRTPAFRTSTDMYEEMVRRLTETRKAVQAHRERIAEEKRVQARSAASSTPTSSKGKMTEVPALADSNASQENISERSSMIFPRLDKESPVPSVHGAAASEAPSAKSEDTTVQSPKPAVSIDSETENKTEVFEDVAEDLESLELESDSEDGGFVTDEEYDVLDASDEEFMQQGGDSKN
ncbi:MAG: hypothetical protein M1821_007283 [Bathelium mastoideum]|nr:MAG: hypothetical protein M1821_007283 [Bathelium mastoideum]